MEKFSLSPNVERAMGFADHQERYAQAAISGEQMIAKIPDFEKMDYREQLSHLKDLLKDLSVENANRFVAEYVAAKMTDIEITAKQAELEIARPDFSRYDNLDLAEEDYARAA